MKVVYIITRSDSIGGSSIHVRDMGAKLQEMGEEPVVLYGGSGVFEDHLAESKLEHYSLDYLVRSISPINDWLAYKEIKSLLKDLKPDLVSLHASKAGFLGRLAAHSLDLPVLFTAHGWSFTDGKSIVKKLTYKNLESSVSGKTNKIICVSEYDRNIAIEKLPVLSEKVITIHNGMPDVEQTYFSNPNKPGTVHIVMVARMDYQKDHFLALEAVKDLPNFHLHFVGDGPLESEIKTKVKSLQLTDKITFHGSSDRVHEILSTAQIFMLTSNWEGFPRSTIEAMRAGLPVVVSDVGGAAEAIEEGVNGFSVPKGDLFTLKHRLSELIEDPELRKRMGKAGRNRYENYFTFERMFDQTFAVYKEILEKGNQSSLGKKSEVSYLKLAKNWFDNC